MQKDYYPSSSTQITTKRPHNLLWHTRLGIYYSIILIPLISEDSPTTISNVVSIHFPPFYYQSFYRQTQTVISCILGFYTPVLHGNISKLVLSEKLYTCIWKNKPKICKRSLNQRILRTPKSLLPTLIFILKCRMGEDEKQNYDKCDGFTFPIVSSPFISINIPAAPVYGDYISQLLRFVRACAQYHDFAANAYATETDIMIIHTQVPHLQ